MHHVVMLSGGLGSWYAAWLIHEQTKYDRNSHMTLLFADTLIEDEDLYRFLGDTAPQLGTFIHLSDGRNPWQVFRDVRFIGNSRLAPCSKVLKQDVCKKWVRENVAPDEPHCLYVGIDWTEAHRVAAVEKGWAPYTVRAPLCEKPYRDKLEAFEQLKALGIEPPRLYALGFAHNNCGGFCVRSGKTQFANLLKKFPERYLWHEMMELRAQIQIGTQSTIMTETKDWLRDSLSLHQYRMRLQAGETAPDDEQGGCGCFVGEVE